MGIIVYDGPSYIDGQPIVGIITGEKSKSENRKIGSNMLQLWILRSDIIPSEAVKTGADHAICGECCHRGEANGERAAGRSCYVNVAFAPTAVYHAYRRRSYGTLATSKQLEDALKGRKIRLGAYGDPLALPIHVIERIADAAAGHLGYTHQWRTPRAEYFGFNRYVMASCETPGDALEAQSRGWRTFRVLRPEDGLLANEIRCPASNEEGHRRTCSTCMACDGADRPGKASVSIVFHGGLATMHNQDSMFNRANVR